MLGINFDIALDLAHVLREKERKFVKDGAISLYHPAHKYIMGGDEKSSNTLHVIWHDFRDLILFKRRFLDSAAKELLESIFIDVKLLKNLSPTLVIEPEDDNYIIFRARKVETGEMVQKIYSNPSLELGPPPIKYSKNGRMNPSGISVFYGALAKDTCIAEVRPVVGGLVVLGKFRPSRSLKIFDLTQFEQSISNISIFHKDFAKLMGTWNFFREFHFLISQPITPYQEELEYIPTQVVAEYISEELNYDGIIFSSSQVGNDANFLTDKRMENIVIFNDNHSESLFTTNHQGLNVPLLYIENSIETYKVEAVKYVASKLSIPTQEGEDF